MKKLLWLVLLASGCGRMMPALAQTTPVVVASTVSCATSVDGTVVGVPNPLVPPITAAAYTGTLPSGNYYVQIGWYDAAGHSTLAGPEVQIQLVATGELQVSPPATGLPSGATGMNVYIGAASGAETLQGQTTSTATFTQSVPLTAGAAEPSVNNTICAVVANDAGWPTGTGYKVSMTSPNGDTVPGYPMQWQLLGPGATINLGNGLPVYSGTVSYGSAIQARPYNHAAQSISGPLSMTGYNLTQVTKLGVGTSVPGWPVDVENGAVNASGGFIYNGGQGVTAGQCLIAGSDPYKTFGPATCFTLPAIYYQTLEAAGSPVTQRAAANFGAEFALSDSVSPSRTTVDLLTQSGFTPGTFTGANVTVNQYGIVTGITNGAPNANVTVNNVTASRTTGVVYHNTGSTAMYVSGNANSNTGGSTAHIALLIGSTSTPTLALGAQEFGATVANGSCPFAGMVPAGWYYELVVTGDVGWGASSLWFEMPFN